MAILETINEDLNKALKASQTSETTTLRSIKAALQNATIENRGKLSDEQVINVLQREVKKRKEAMELYEKSGRKELAENEKTEATIIEKYLPEQISEDELRELVAKAIEQTGAQAPTDTGKVIGAVMAEAKGRVDGGRVAALVREKLS